MIPIMLHLRQLLEDEAKAEAAGLLEVVTRYLLGYARTGSSGYRNTEQNTSRIRGKLSSDHLSGSPTPFVS